MNKVFESIGNAFSKLAFSIQKNSPELKFWGGFGLMAVGTGLAIYQSVKRVPEIKRETNIMRKDLDARMMITEMTDEEVKKEQGKITRHAFGNYVKAFALPTVLYAGGATSEILGFREEKTRYVAAAAQATATAAAFAAYRQRNAKLIGEDNERALYYGADVKTVTETQYDDDGNVIGTSTKYELVQRDDAVVDPYTYEFSPETTDACRENDDMYEYNMAFLKGVEADWNHIFIDFDTKIVWLVDLLRALGLENESRVCSRNVGWLNPKFFNTTGDGYIDFRIQPMRYIASDGKERWKFMLNFNCDGLVYEVAKNQLGPMGVIGHEIP